ncbi:MAG: arginyltransferase [Lysobacterales bacterium]
MAESVRLFRTQDHPCGYYADRTANNLVLDPEEPRLAQVFEQALEHGFPRRRPHLSPRVPRLRACVATRIAADRFEASRRHQRVWAQNQDLRVEIEPAHESEQHLSLYQRYLSGCHAGAGMDDGDPEGFSRFLLSTWADTVFINHYLGDDLVAIAVTDCTPNALSAIYTFYAPSTPNEASGSLAILQQIEYARRTSRPYLYLGFWINGHPKMHYKAEFRLELRNALGKWTAFENPISPRAARVPTPETNDSVANQSSD